VIELPDTDINGDSLPEGVQPGDYWAFKPYEDTLDDPFTNDVTFIDTLPDNFTPRYFYSVHSRRIYAANNGTIEVFLRTRARLGDGNFGVKRFTYQISAASEPARARSVFWNQKGYRGPNVTVPVGTVTSINFVYNGQIPESVTEEYQEPGKSNSNPNDVSELRTVWFDRTTGFVNAYNVEGRMLAEFLGPNTGEMQDLRNGGAIELYQSLGVLVLEIERGVEPTNTGNVFIGDRVLPVEEPFADALDWYQPRIPLQNSTGNELEPLEATYDSNQAIKYFTAIKTTSVGERVTVYWMADAEFYDPEANSGAVESTGIRWPKYHDQYTITWPDLTTSEGQQLYARYAVPFGSEGDLRVRFDAGVQPTILFNDPDASAEVDLDPNQRIRLSIGEDGQARALLRFSSTEGDPWYQRFLFRPVTSLLTATSEVGLYNLWLPSGESAPYDAGALQEIPVEVGETISAPPGLGLVGSIRGTTTAPFATNLYADPLSEALGSTLEESLIIPVNSLPGRDLIEVWWSTEVAPPSYASADFEPLLIPHALGRYRVSWPDDAPVVYLGREPTGATRTSGYNGKTILPESWNDTTIYRNRDAASAGYNPNEEHAFIRTGELFVLRDDLNDYSTTSKPFVLVQYQPASGGAPRMAVFEVQRGELDYLAVAGSAVGGINSLTALSTPLVPELDANGTATGRYFTRNREITKPDFPDGLTSYAQLDIRDLVYPSFTVADKIGTTWIYRGPHDEDTGSELLMEYFYPFLDDFDIPGIDSSGFAASGVVLPFVRAFDRDAEGNILTKADGTPLFSRGYQTETVTLGSGETLTLPKFDSEGKIVFRAADQTDTNLLDDLPAPVVIRPIWPDYFDLANAGLDPSDPDYEDPLDYGISPQQLTYGTLRQGETLYAAKNGLPALGSAVSAEILYDQERARTYSDSTPKQAIQLVDPTVAKKYFLTDATSSDLDALPAVPTTTSQGRVYFSNLPSHLESRFYYAPNEGELGALVFEGEFVEEVAGEDYLQLNILSETDIATLKAIVPTSLPDKNQWDAAIDALEVTLTTYQKDIFEIARPLTSNYAAENILLDPDIEEVVKAQASDDATYGYIYGETFGPGAAAVVRNDDQAVDRYSAVGTAQNGDRWVTVVSGNGSASDPGDPTQLFIFKSSPELFIGEGKIVASQNPLNERVSVRLSNDFGGKADRFEIQWASSDPGENGVPPAKPEEGSSAQLPWFADPAYTEPGLFLINVGGTGVDVIKDKYYSARYRRLDDSDSPVAPWSDWSEPILIEGWIKRVLAGINPFNQRLTDFANNPVNSDVSILTQAGERWEGDVPLNLENINDFGLIAIYETVLKRGINLSIGASPPVNDRTANRALLLAANYLGDLYSALGDEAYSDALNPTVALDAEVIDTTLQVPDSGSFMEAFGETATARYSFEGQVPSLLQEELTLLRGRDDFLATRVNVSPVYNRLYWNFTRGIDLGEVIYALNYNIREGASSPSADGTLDAADAARLFPQGHGDAYGHYLTALKNYYRLLANPNYDWIPEAETINLVGQTVQVDYRDERKFASTAASLAETAALIANLTHRQNYRDTADEGWSHLGDGAVSPTTGKTRNWGVDDWVSRGYQATYYNWLTVNTILPAAEALGLDPDSLTPDVTRITRSDVEEVDLLPFFLESLQQEVDLADQHLSPIGLRSGSMAFDLSAADYRNGKSHFEQVYERATRAVANAESLFSRAADTTRLLRVQSNQVDNLDKVITDNETAFEYQLLDLLGSPFPEDIGPGKTYPQGYTGPDYYNFMKIERVHAQDTVQRGPLEMVAIGQRANNYLDASTQAQLLANLYSKNKLEAFFAELRSRTGVDNSNPDELVDAGSYPLYTLGFLNVLPPSAYDIPNLRLSDVNSVLSELGLNQITLATGSAEGTIAPETVELVYQYDPRDAAIFAGAEAGRRYRQGLIQQQLRRVVEARVAHEGEIDAFYNAVVAYERLVQLKREGYLAMIRVPNLEDTLATERSAAELGISILQSKIDALKKAAAAAKENADAAKEAPPTAAGTSNDATSGARSAIKAAAAAINKALFAGEKKFTLGISILKGILGKLETDTNKALRENANTQLVREMIYELEVGYDQLVMSAATIDQTAGELALARGELDRLLHEADHILAERERFRQRVAGVVHGYRIRDVAYRGLRNESLEQYRNLFDLASQYTYLAAKAYDYETGLLGTESGVDVFNDIVSSRALGVVEDGEPRFIGNTTGDPGLSGVLAQLDADWQVAKSRLGINNPDALGTTFSLRQELLRILPTYEGDAAWIQFLESCLVKDLRLDPDVSEHALGLDDGSGLPVPGLVIEFPTTIESGKNFFGKPLAAGDSTFYSGSFATKIHSLGVVFTDYAGVDHTAINGEPSNSLAENGLAATPYVYLMPVGADRLRVPVGGNSEIRSFDVHDQILPLPFNLGANSGSEPSVSFTLETLPEMIFEPRRHQAFRAVDNPSFFYSPFYEEFTSSRLIGRSAWNSGWKLVIPGRSLLADEEEGLSRFLRSVKDIQIHLRTYSHSGN
jgi:hypothetical protein